MRSTNLFVPFELLDIYFKVQVDKKQRILSNKPQIFSLHLPCSRTSQIMSTSWSRLLTIVTLDEWKLGRGMTIYGNVRKLYFRNQLLIGREWSKQSSLTSVEARIVCLCSKHSNFE